MQNSVVQGDRANLAYGHLAQGISLGTALVVILLGSVVLVGWMLDSETLKSVFPGWVSMKANTAIGFLLCGLAMLLSFRGANRFRLPALMPALVVAFIGILTLAEYFFDLDLKIDEVFFSDSAVLLKTSHPGRMAPTTALCFALAGTALFVSGRPFFAGTRRSFLKTVGAAVMLIGIFALVGYGADALTEVRWWTYTGMAAHTAIGFVLLGTGFLAWAFSDGGRIWSLDFPTTCGFACGIILMLLAVNVIYHFTGQLFQTANLVAHRQEVLREIATVAAATDTLESSQRGYLITGEERFLVGREETRASAMSALQALRGLTRDNPALQRHVEAIESLATKVMHWEEDTIATRRKEGFPRAAAMVSQGSGIALRTDIHHRLQMMREAEYALLDSDKKKAETASTTTFLLLPIGVFLSLTMLLGGLIFLNAGTDERVSTERRLRVSQKDVQDLQDTLDQHAIVTITDPNGKITHVNDEFCKISKYSREELLGTDHRLVNSGHHSREFFEDLWTTIAKGQVWKSEIKNRAKDGSSYWVDTTIVPFLDESGKVRQYVSIYADITRLKVAEQDLRTLNAGLEQRVRERTAELAQRRAELESLFESLPGLYLVLTPDLAIVAASDAYLKATMTTRGEIVGRQLFEVFPDNPDDPDATGVSNLRASLGSVLENGAPHTMAIQRYDIRRPDGTFDERYWSPINSPIAGANQEVKYIIHRVEDVTEFVRQKPRGNPVEWHARMQRMEAEIFLSSQKVQEANRQLEVANKELEAFSYSVSHDLRAPLRAIDGFSQAVLEDFGSQLPEEGRRHLQIIREGAQRMGMLIDDLLGFSRLSRMPLNKQEVDTAKLVREVLADLRPQQEGRKIDLRIGELPPCAGDPSLLKQGWINLLSNALKYTRKRDPAVVEIGCEHTPEGDVFFVRDNGTGFDMRYADKLFGVFQRLHREEEYEGTGVGLAIVQRIIHRHGGRLWADAAVDRGAAFYFTLKGKTES